MQISDKDNFAAILNHFWAKITKSETNQLIEILTSVYESDMRLEIIAKSGKHIQIDIAICMIYRSKRDNKIDGAVQCSVMQCNAV